MVLRPIIPEKRAPTYTECSDNSSTLREVCIFIRANFVHYAYQLDDAQLLPLFHDTFWLTLF